MTIADSPNPSMLMKPTLPPGPAVEVRWLRVQPRILSGGVGHAAVPCRSELVIAVQCIDANRGRLDLWVDTPTGQQLIREAQNVSVTVTEADSLTHVDVTGEDRRLLSLTLARDGSTVYAQSCLLTEAGFEPGTYDRPRSHFQAIQSHIASA